MNVDENKEVESSKKSQKEISVKAIPDKYAGATPLLYVNMASAAIDFYQKAFNAKSLGVLKDDKNRIVHAEIEIGKAIVMLSDEFPEMDCYSPRHLGGTTSCITLYFEDADKIFSQAIAAGAQALDKLADQFWGDRGGKIVDPFGHQWYILTHKEDVSDDEMKNRMEKMIKSQQVH